MKSDKNNLLLYAVTDRSWLGSKTLCEQAEEALAGGATFLQLREKDIDDDSFLEEARSLRQLCSRYNVPFVVNDNVDIAIKSGADGVHVGQSDMQACDVRALIGPDKILGVSAQTVEQAILAEKQGADYLGVGAVFTTGSKADADYVSYETLCQICSAVNIPVIAIGGIGRHNVMQLAGSGICGIAVISAIFAAQNITEATALLKAETVKMVNRKICGAIFDLDGTLLDSMAMWDTVAEDYLRSLGKEPRENLKETFRTFTLEQSAEYFIKNYGVRLRTEEIVEGINSYIASFYNNTLRLKPGILQLLETLEAEGIRMCVATVTDKRLAEAALCRLGVRGFFEEIITCKDVGHGKEEPHIYRAAAARLGTHKNQTAVFEDSLHALLTAAADGFFAVGVCDSFESRQQQMKDNASCYIADLRDCRDFLKLI